MYISSWAIWVTLLISIVYLIFPLFVFIAWILAQTSEHCFPVACSVIVDLFPASDNFVFVESIYQSTITRIACLSKDLTDQLGSRSKSLTDSPKSHTIWVCICKLGADQQQNWFNFEHPHHTHFKNTNNQGTIPHGPRFLSSLKVVTAKISSSFWSLPHGQDICKRLI